uniref:chorismate-binding protein n=1 Tax=Nocardia abscessus TaxID=120957 RepID=UPI002453A90B
PRPPRPPAPPGGGSPAAPGGGPPPAGPGAWVVAIRCAELAADGRTVRAYAGGGIVAASDPQAELDETTAKLRTLLGALHCDLPPR